MIHKTPTQFEQITSAECDSCGEKIPVNFGELTAHVKIGGHHEGKLLDAIVCIKCMNEKMGFINIQKKDSTIGYC